MKQTKEEFKKSRLLALKCCAAALGTSFSQQDVDWLCKAVDEYRSSDRDYEELEWQEKIEQIRQKNRAESRLPVSLLEEFDDLQANLRSLKEDPNQTVRWNEAYRKLIVEFDRNPALLSENEAPEWLARSVVFLSHDELAALFEKFWSFCVKESPSAPRISSILSVMANSLPSRHKDVLEKKCKLETGKTYNYQIVAASRSLQHRS